MDDSTTSARHATDEKGAEPIADRPLPAAIGENARTVLGLHDRPTTFGALAGALRSVFVGERDRALGPDDLCHVENSPHEARVGDETHHFQCVLDAFVLVGFVHDPVSVRSVDPVSGTPIVAQVAESSADASSTDAPATDAVPTDVSLTDVTPTDAVVSFGIEHDAAEHDDPLTPAGAYGALCPFVNAFRTRSTYEEWDEETPDAATTAVSVPDAIALGRALVG